MLRVFDPADQVRRSTGEQAGAELCDEGTHAGGVDPWRIGPMSDRRARELRWRARVAGDEVHVEVGRRLCGHGCPAEDEGIHVIGCQLVPQQSGQPIGEPPDPLRLGVVQEPDPFDVTTRLHHEMAPIGAGPAHGVDMPGIDELVQVEDPTLGVILGVVLGADEAGGGLLDLAHTGRVRHRPVSRAGARERAGTGTARCRDRPRRTTPARWCRNRGCAGRRRRRRTRRGWGTPCRSGSAPSP